MAKIVDYNATVVSRVDLNPFLTIMGIKTDQATVAFKPGQYTVLGLKAREKRVEGSLPDEKLKEPDQTVQRAYSIASANHSGILEFYLALVSHGELTPRLFALQQSDRLYVSTKVTGVFTLDQVDPKKSLLLMATGTGLAPFISMVRSNFDWSTGRKVVIMHGVRHSGDLGYKDELEKLAQEQPNFIYMPIVSQPAKDLEWTGLTGYLQEVLFDGEVAKRTGLQITPENFDAFLCGNPAMIEAAIAKFNSLGFILAKGKTPGTIHIEEYW